MSKNIKFDVKLNHKNIKDIENKMDKALFLTAEALHTEVVQAQVMPKDVGTMQNESTFVEPVSKGKVKLKTSTAYARRLYFHPEYNFSKADNHDAQGRWWDRWISGSEKDWCQKAFAKILKRLMGG